MNSTKENTPIPSPDGTYSALVVSSAYGDRGNTSVMIEAPQSGSGSGVFHLELPHVPLRVNWTGNAELVIAHPKEIAPRKSDPLARQERVQFADPEALARLSAATAGIDPRDNPEEYLAKMQASQADAKPRFVTIKYAQYEGAGKIVEELRRKAGAAEPRKAPKNFLSSGMRGRLTSPGFGYSYDYSETQGELATLLQTRGYQGGGESWAGIVYGLLKLKAPEVLSRVEIDPEGDALRVTSKSRVALEKIAELFTLAHNDTALLDQAIERAEADGEME